MNARTLSSRIESVTVYKSGARITRAAGLEAGPDGYPEEVRITNLPLSLDDDSLRVRIEPVGSNDGASLPVAADLHIGLDVPETDETLPHLKDEDLDVARRKVISIRDQMAQLQVEIKRLGALDLEPRASGREGEPPPPSPSEARLSLIAFHRNELERLHSEVHEKAEAFKTASDMHEELEYQSRLASTARRARREELRKAAVVQLSGSNGADLAPECRILVEYIVPGARWSPAYTVRFASDFSRASLALRALVCQRSGENWDGVEITLSTANVMAWTELPDLPSLRIGRKQPPLSRTGWREPPKGAETLYADYDLARRLAPPTLQPAPEPGADSAVFDEAKDEPDEDELYGAAVEDDEEDVWEDEMEGGPPEETMAKEALMDMELSAPPPMPASMPPPARAKSASAPMKKYKAERRMQRAPRGGKMDAFASPGGTSIETETEEPELTASADLLRYGRLRLAGADEPGRGKLRPAATEDGYVEMLSELRVVADFSVEAWVRTQVSAADGAADAPLPTGHCPPSTEDGFDYAFRGENRVDVPSDDAYHTLPLLERKAESNLHYVVVPREIQDVFRFVSFKNPLHNPLLRGPADIYIGGDYAITTSLKTVAPRGAVEMGLGVEEAIKVARNTRFTEHTGGLLGGHVDLEHEITVEIANNLKHPAEVEVRERVPSVRPGDDQIEVDVTEAEPDWEKYRQKDAPIPGSFRWRVRIQPQAKEILRARYVVRISSKKELQGGNRRE